MIVKEKSKESREEYVDRVQTEGHNLIVEKDFKGMIKNNPRLDLNIDRLKELAVESLIRMTENSCIKLMDNENIYDIKKRMEKIESDLILEINGMSEYKNEQSRTAKLKVMLADEESKVAKEYQKLEKELKEYMHERDVQAIFERQHDKMHDIIKATLKREDNLLYYDNKNKGELE